LPKPRDVCAMSSRPKSPIEVTLTFDPVEMARRGRIGAFRLHATHDPRETTAAARSTFLAKFEAQVDPDGTLPPEERQRRACYARKAHFVRLARLSAIARSGKKTQKGATAGEAVAQAGGR
jgi:hypothetical protein